MTIYAKLNSTSDQTREALIVGPAAAVVNDVLCRRHDVVARTDRMAANVPNASAAVTVP